MSMSPMPLVRPLRRVSASRHGLCLARCSTLLSSGGRRARSAEGGARCRASGDCLPPAGGRLAFPRTTRSPAGRSSPFLARQTRQHTVHAARRTPSPIASGGSSSRWPAGEKKRRVAAFVAARQRQRPCSVSSSNEPQHVRIRNEPLRWRRCHGRLRRLRPQLRRLRYVSPRLPLPLPSPFSPRARCAAAITAAFLCAARARARRRWR